MRTGLLVGLPSWGGGPAHDCVPYLWAQQAETCSQRIYEYKAHLSVRQVTGSIQVKYYITSVAYFSLNEYENMMLTDHRVCRYLAQLYDADRSSSVQISGTVI
jgi:hypothetical protein